MSSYSLYSYKKARVWNARGKQCRMQFEIKHLCCSSSWGVGTIHLSPKVNAPDGLTRFKQPISLRLHSSWQNNIRFLQFAPPLNFYNNTCLVTWLKQLTITLGLGRPIYLNCVDCRLFASFPTCRIRKTFIENKYKSLHMHESSSSNVQEACSRLGKKQQKIKLKVCPHLIQLILNNKNQLSYFTLWIPPQWE